MSSPTTTRKKITTGVSFEPEVVRVLDALVLQTGLNRSWVVNTIVLEYYRMSQQGQISSLMSRENIIKI